ncbi:DotI/IcmL family type IV secretion protein [Ralstonia sp. ASV6]|uniref:DotI/IcmL family type IV secretion protein n=1 Tax=Ralstonia sp. ASV6 TaxID=2795124 RepID=UPI0018ED4A8D|nr:DotI/IcmL family type IV secretion protein [Ralstonia sp. ASV6]
MTTSNEKPSANAKVATTQSTVAHVIGANRVEEEAKENEQRHSLNYLSVITVLSVVILFLLWLIFIHFPLANHIPTQNAAAVCRVTPVNQPRLTEAQVKDFAQEMAVAVYSTDFANYRRNLNDAGDKFMLPSFREQWIRVMSTSDFIKILLENKFIVTAVGTANKPPVVVRSGLLSGAYAWKIQVPLTLFYQSGRVQKDEHVIVEVTVTQVDPTQLNLNPRGIAVSWADTKPALN